MKTFSAPKLLRLALTGSHLPSCPHVHDNTSGQECLCWKHEVRRWAERVRLASTNRTRKSRPPKVHLTHYKCSAKAPQKTSTILQEITCQQCLKHSTRPVKTPKLRKTKNLSSSIVTTTP